MGKKIRSIKINERSINTNTSPYVVAEISGNHSGKISNLKRLIFKAKRSGCDAVKIQAYQANTITIDSKKKDFLIDKKNTWKKYKNLFSLYKKAETPFKWYAEIFKYCKKIKITVFASVYYISSVKVLEKINCPAYKIASPEITDIPLISCVAKTKKPIILSNGLSNYADLSLAIKTIRKEKNNNIIVLKCTSAYPAPLDEINLKTMIEIKKKFNCLSGFSDHTLGINTAVHAASMGASMIEKHICLKKNIKTIDSFFSSTPHEFKKMISIIRDNLTTTGKIDFTVSKSSKKNMNGRRSLYIVNKIKKDEKLTAKNIRSIRPQYGLHPKYLKKILNKKVKKDIEAGEPFKLSYLR